MAGDESIEIIDTHQHLWDLEKFRLNWLNGADEVLRHSYRTEEYRTATPGLKIRAVYMEVDVDPTQHVLEAEHILQLCESGDHPTVAAVIGGRPASEGFADYIRRFQANPLVKGVRQVLHGDSTPAGYCLQESFVKGVRLLGQHGKRFDLCMRPGELADGGKLAEMCQDTSFILDHCGNADPQAFRVRKNENEPPTHDADQWRRDIEGLSMHFNIVCKISGIVARAPRGWTADDLAPIVNHCLDCFGPDRVIFGSDWPVCLLGAPLMDWVTALRSIITDKSAEDQRRLWRDNAARIYELNV
jgi:L-fuconolactonase